jgi:hypothetical protein
MTPSWYGVHYPTIEDLVLHAERLGAFVGFAEIGEDAVFFPPDPLRNEPPVILLPEGVGLLRQSWLLAHELGHLSQHSGPKGERSHGKEECQADCWAACALIPETRILAYHNACLDSMVAALSAHFEDLPLIDCPSRRLAGRIARVRLNCLAKSCPGIFQELA